MIWLKSVLVGLSAAFLTIVVVLAATPSWFVETYDASGGLGGVSIAISEIFLLPVLIAFVLGSWWSIRRQRRRGNSFRNELMISVLALCVNVACAAQPAQSRFLLTAAPIQLVADADLKQCVAVEPGNPEGVWWWSPGLDGCSTRTTGPDVFPALTPSVSQHANGTIDVRFSIGRRFPPPETYDVHFTIREGHFIDACGARSRAEPRTTLQVPAETFQRKSVDTDSRARPCR